MSPGKSGAEYRTASRATQGGSLHAGGLEHRRPAKASMLRFDPMANAPRGAARSPRRRSHEVIPVVRPLLAVMHLAVDEVRPLRAAGRRSGPRRLRRRRRPSGMIAGAICRIPPDTERDLDPVVPTTCSLLSDSGGQARLDEAERDRVDVHLERPPFPRAFRGDRPARLARPRSSACPMFPRARDRRDVDHLRRTSCPASLSAFRRRGGTARRRAGA